MDLPNNNIHPLRSTGVPIRLKAIEICLFYINCYILKVVNTFKSFKHMFTLFIRSSTEIPQKEIDMTSAKDLRHESWRLYIREDPKHPLVGQHNSQDIHWK